MFPSIEAPRDMNEPPSAAVPIGIPARVALDPAAPNQDQPIQQVLWHADRHLNRLAPSYVELARQASTTLDTMQRSRQLLVLDLNGTLLSRNKNRKSMYVRPHIDLFLRYIFARFEVMVWSSASRKSVHNMLHLFGKKRRSLLAVWTREDLGLTQEQFDAKVPTCKDLQRLIDAPLLRDHQPPYDLSNIIVLDDSPRKITMQPFNCVAVRTFHHTDPDFGTHGDQELLRVMQYLDRLCLETNVPGFIRTTPYNDKFTLKESTFSDLDIQCRFYMIGNVAKVGFVGLTKGTEVIVTEEPKKQHNPLLIAASHDASTPQPQDHAPPSTPDQSQPAIPRRRRKRKRAKHE